MTVLILFATVEGQTGKVARFVRDRASELGVTARLVDLSEPMATVDFGDATRVVLAAPVHERRHPAAFEVFVQANQERLSGLPVMMLSISLKAAFPDGHAEAVAFLEEMKMRTGLVPDHEVLVAGAVRAASYDYFEQQVLQHVVLEGQGVNVADGPHEFTDWDALVTEIDPFLQES